MMLVLPTQVAVAPKVPRLQAIASLKQLQELRLQCNDIAAERNPFQACVRIFRDLPHLRKASAGTGLALSAAGRRSCA